MATASTQSTNPARIRYPHALSPIKIGPVEIRNRIFMPAHGIGLVAGGPNGTKFPSDDCAFYFAERAAGGVGLVIHSVISGPGGFASPLYEASIPSFKAVAEAVHRYGARIFGQIWIQPAGTWEPLSPLRPMLGASPLPRIERYDGRRGIARSSMADLIGAFEPCARHLAAAGYDGVEVHGAHGLLIEQFLSPFFNHRTDEYGRDIEGRMRTLTDILRKVRAAMGKDKAVGVRMNCDEMLPGGLTQDDAKDILDRLIKQKLIDFANLDSGVAPQRSAIKPHFVPPLHQRPFVESVGAVTRSRIVTISAIGRVTAIAQAEQMIAEGVADMIGIARGLIAEPELVKNAIEGREERSRICVSGNVCSAGLLTGSWTCALNPAVGKERLWGNIVNPASVKRGKVVVVGGGPAGLEAARVASIQGHRVVLMERSHALGGQLRDWVKLPDRQLMQSTIEWYRARLAELDVEVRLGREATEAAVLLAQPDAVIVATGAAYYRDGTSGLQPFAIPGWDAPIVHTPESVLSGNQPAGDVLILDEEGLHTGVGIAEMLAKAGAKVELVTSQAQFAANLVATFEAGIIVSRLKALGVRLTTGSYVKEILDREVVVYDVHTRREERRKVDGVVLATRRGSVCGLEQQLEGKAAQVFVIGDALSPRSLSEATYEGHRFARLIGAESAPKTTDEALMRPPLAAATASPASVLIAAAARA